MLGAFDKRPSSKEGGGSNLEFSTVKGFKDILPSEAGKWQKLEASARKVFHSFGYHEIRTPLLERTELFSRGIGQDTDIVSKEMYSLEDSKGRGMTMRPEATASVVRAYIQHRLYQASPVQKLFSIGPMFRHERPQKGRFRQFHQVNAEILGDPGPRSDAEIIIMAVFLLETIGVKSLSLKLNSLGCPTCRPRYKEELRDYLLGKVALFCSDCRRRSEVNPLRVFDCKMEECNRVVEGAPSTLEFLCDECRDHFESVQGYLKRSDVSFVLDHRLVRGLDYYTRTAFEIQTELLGSQNAVAGGGRYDGLIKLLGGPDHPAIGFALGIERVISLVQGQDEEDFEIRGPDLFIAALGDNAVKGCFKWVIELRKAGFWVEMDYASRGLKAQMKKADRLRARKVLIVGDDELASGRGILRDLVTGDQGELGLDAIATIIEKVL